MKKKYLSPEMEIEKFTIDDVIKTSGPGGGGGGQTTGSGSQIPGVDIQMDVGEY